MQELELSNDFIHVQSVFIDLNKSLGCLKQIRYKGGNEEKITSVLDAVRSLLIEKDYVKHTLVNKKFKSELEKIVLFLMLNTDLEKPLDLTCFAHLTGIMLPISKCLLAHIVVELHLGEEFATALCNFSVGHMEEFLVEMVPCLKRSDPRLHLEYVCVFIEKIIDNISGTKLSKETEESLDKITDLVSHMLLNLTGFHADHSDIRKKDFVYGHMGYTLLRVLNLLVQCDPSNATLLRIIEKLLSTCSTILMAVTLDVFCSWAEIEEDHQNLQTLVGTCAYNFIEKYEKFKPAQELISMMGSIAQKPKTLNELIHQADVRTMISHANRPGKDQKEWFKAVLYTQQALKNEEAVACIEKWSHLCDAEDVLRLLHLSCQNTDRQDNNNDNNEAKKVIVKCLAHLNLDDLKIVSVRHFHQNGILNANHNLTDDVQQELISLFNKLRGSERMSDDFAKELHLLLLRNPADTLTYLFGECLKNNFYTATLKDFLPSIKEIACVENVGLNILIELVGQSRPNDKTCASYAEFFSALVHARFYSIEVIVLEIILPGLQNSLREQDYEAMTYQLDVLSLMQENVWVKDETTVLFSTLFSIMHTCRTVFLEFNRTKQEILQKTVGLVERYCEANRNPPHSVSTIKSEEDPYVTFYKSRLLRNDYTSSLFKHLCPSFSTSSGHGHLVALLIKILPMCTKQEWLSICTDCCRTFGVEETAESLTDVLIMLCQLIRKQERVSDEVGCMLNGLKYCLQNFGIVIKECLQLRIQSLEEDVSLTRNVCRLLKEIPEDQYKREEGLSLANLLSDRSLKFLRNDRKFACLLVSINETHLCQVLAQKVLK